MPKKSKKHVLKPTSEKKPPRISVMAKQKKDRQKLYLYLSLAAIVVLAAGIAIGTIFSGSGKAPVDKFELNNGQFVQKDGYFEMTVPSGWGMYSTIADVAPYGLDKVPNPYVFIPSNYKTVEKTEGMSTTKASPNNMLFTIVPKDYSTAEVEGFLTDQNVLGEIKIVEYLQKNASTVGRKLASCSGWVLGEKPEHKVTSGSLVGYIRTGDTQIFFTVKAEDKIIREAIIKSLDSIKTAQPASLDSYTDPGGSLTIPRPQGWVIDTDSQTIGLHQVVIGKGALFYPEGTKTSMSMSPSEVQSALEKNNQDMVGKQVLSSMSIPMPLYTYIAVYALEKNTNPENLNKMFFDSFVGFSQDLNITKPYDWIKENIAKKGLLLANNPGKYFISDQPVKIMQVKPKENLFATIETKTGTVLFMAGWTNDTNKKTILDTLNAIKLTAK